MSYCVNCGVELADSERRCPLCHTEVHNPRQPYDRKIPKPFPNRLDLFEPEDNRGFAAAITTLLLALPAAICLACDVAYTRGAGWSMLVTGAMAMLWVFIVPPIFLRRHKVLLCGTLDTAAVLGYLWMVEHYAAKGSWFQAMAVPLVVLVGCRAAHVGQLATGVAVVLAGMPMGGTTTILAEKYGADSTFASKCTAISTVLSFITTPLWCLVV